MKRLSLAVLLSVSLLAVLAMPAAAAPHNKNSQLVVADCDNGKTYTVDVNQRSNFNAAVHVEGVGPSKTISFTAFAPGTSDVLFSQTSNFPKAPNLTCTGTISQVDPTTGQVVTFDFVAEVYLKNK
jgi:hypothetical protein